MDAHHDECWIHCCFKPRNGEASLLESCEPLYCKKRCIRKQPTHLPIPSHQDTVQSFIMTPCYSRINLRRPYFNHQGNARWRLIIERLTTGDDRSKTKSGNWEKPAQWRQNSCFVPKKHLGFLECNQINHLLPHIILPEGCLIALLAEEKDDPHCHPGKMSDIKLSQTASILCSASSTNLPSTPSPLHNS